MNLFVLHISVCFSVCLSNMFKYSRQLVDCYLELFNIIWKN